MAAFEMFEAIQARDWETAGMFVANDALIVWPATGERFVGERYLAMNRDYPEGWDIEVIDQYEGDNSEVLRARVRHGDHVFWCVGFYDVGGDVITGGVEYWIEEGAEEPPRWRGPYAD
jgi:hypothetical protein